MANEQVILITGTRKGIGAYLAGYYTNLGAQVIGCSRGEFAPTWPNYRHYRLDVTNEVDVRKMFAEIRTHYGRLDILINNAGIAFTNHFLLTPVKSALDVFNTNVIGTFLFCREAAHLMKAARFGRIVNFTSLSVPLKLEGEAIYAASKAATITLTQILAREVAEMGITVNAIGPTPIKTDMISQIASTKIDDVIGRQAIRRYGEFSDVANVVDFFIKPESAFVTGQTLFLGGI